MDGEERKNPDHLVVGHVSKPHGTKGEVFVWPLTDRVEAVFEPGRVLMLEASDEPGAEDYGELVIESVRSFKRGLLIKFAGFENREANDGLAQRYLRLPIEEVPPLEEGEVFFHQLIGLEVRTVEGERIGMVREIYDMLPTQLLEIRTEAGKSLLIPFTERIVRQVDVEAGTLSVDPPPGLLDL